MEYIAKFTLIFNMRLEISKKFHTGGSCFGLCP